MTEQVKKLNNVGKVMKTERLARLGIVNLITLSRYVLAAAALYETYKENYLLAFPLLGVGIITDIADGHLARKWLVESKIGAFGDATADGLLFGSIPAVLAKTFGFNSALATGILVASVSVNTIGRLFIDALLPKPRR